MRLSALLLLALAPAGCFEGESSPDARRPVTLPDGRTADARPSDARPADARPEDAGAQPIDAPPPIDAPVEMADAAPAIDAPLPEPDAEPPPPPAGLLINEVNGNLGSRALIELLVTQGGTTAGWKLERDYRTGATVVANLPDVVVATGDLIVIHMTPAGGTVLAETTAKDQHQTSENFDGAWDFFGTPDVIGDDNRILVLRDPAGEVDSLVPFFRPDIADPARTFFPGDVQAAIDAGLWNETCVPAPCTYSSNLDDVTVTWTGLGDTREGASVSRKPGGVNEKKRSDWQDVPESAPLNTFGAPN
jgi:hypothetical protein